MPKVHRQFPMTRLRRTRYYPFSRNLVREHHLKPHDLIYSLFLIDGENKREKIEKMPGLERLSIDLLLEEVGQAQELGIPMVALFPSIPKERKSVHAEEAFNEQGLVPRAVRAIKEHFPEMGVMVDIALDAYTLSGHDGYLGEDGRVDNDRTVAALQKQSLVLAAAGADVIAPSDSMDGRIGLIRQALEEHHFKNTLIMAYAAKYASAFYTPYRDAIQSLSQLGQSDKKNYQMDPANIHEALHETMLDIAEGADIVMVKPGTLYLDVLYRIKEAFQVPTAVFQVSGEYSMIQNAINQNMLTEAVIWESLLAFKRAGADMIISYFAKRAAEHLKKG